MAQTLKISLRDGKEEEFEKINDISFMGGQMIVCATDLETRYVFDLSNIQSYVLKNLTAF